MLPDLATSSLVDVQNPPAEEELELYEDRMRIQGMVKRFLGVDGEGLVDVGADGMYVCVYLRMCVCVCICVSMCACMYGRTYVRMYVCVCVYVSMA